MAYNPITNPLNVAINEISTGGALVKNHVSNGTDLVNVKTGVTKLTGWYILNYGSTVARISFYDATTAPAIGDTGADFRFSIVIPAGGLYGAAANVSIPAGIQFTTGLSFNIGGNSVLNTGNAPVSAGTVNLNLFYK